MSLTLLTRSNVVISTVVWQFWGSGWVPQVSALGVILILFATIVVGTVRFALSRIGEIGSGVAAKQIGDSDSWSSGVIGAMLQTPNLDRT